MLRYELGVRLGDLVGNVGMREAVDAVVAEGEAAGWLPALVTAVRSDRPGNAAIQAWEPADVTLERVIRGHVPDLDPARWRPELEALEGRVCRVEAATAAGARPLGTGFLVGPDLCLTAGHVIGDRSALRARFGEVVTGLEPVATDRDLDVALLRTDGRPGDTRGWLDLSYPDAPQPDDSLLILHRPAGGPLRLSIGAVLDPDGSGLRHTANTEPGSSGAPCLTVGLHLVAMHQGGDPAPRPAFNRAIPVRAIRRALPDPLP